MRVTRLAIIDDCLTRLKRLYSGFHRRPILCFDRAQGTISIPSLIPLHSPKSPFTYLAKPESAQVNKITTDSAAATLTLSKRPSNAMQCCYALDADLLDQDALEAVTDTKTI